MSEVSQGPYEIVTTKHLIGKTEHHPQGMSTLERLYECPASYFLSKDEPETASEYAEEGTLLHEMAANLIGGRKGWASEDVRRITDEQRDLVERCYDFFDEHMPANCQTWVEQKVTLSDDEGMVNFGTADMIACDGEKVVIFDWKFGRKVKEKSLALQISAYAAASAQSLDKLTDCQFLPIEAYAYFPRTGESLVWKAESGNEAIRMVAPSVRAIVKAAQESDGTGAVPGSYCEHCNHLPNCEAVRLVATEVLAPASKESITNWDKDDPFGYPVRALYLYDLSLIVEKQAAAVRGRIREQLLIAPDSIPGLILKSRNGKRAATAEIKQRIVGAEGLSVIEYMKALEPNVVALENAYVAKYHQGRGKGKPSVEKIKKSFVELCGDAIKRTSSKVLTRVEGK